MEKRLDIIYNLKYLVIIPIGYKDMFESINYTFDNTIIMENNIEDVNLIIKFINQNNIKDIIFVDYFPDYTLIMNGLLEKHNYKILYTKTLASLSNIGYYDMYKTILELLNNNTIKSIGVLDESMYEVMKTTKKATQIYLNIGEQEKSEESNTIGLLNIQDNDYHSFYNELSAIKLCHNKIAKIRKPGPTTKEFISNFNIPTIIKKDEDIIKNNCLNLNINFTEICTHNFLKSMNQSIPCIIGNNSFLTGDLEKYLVVNSDDNIDEIKEKIDYALKNKDKIMKLYQTFKKEYDKKTNKLVEEFLECKKEQKEKKEYKKLISVIVPVYNVEKYLEKSLDSIIEAAIDDMEILIINDGSTDSSEEIIKKYENNYPELIRYIKKKNGGLGSVRNVGLKEAKGKYIASIDSDDTINSNFFIEAEKYLKEDIDLVICDWLSINEDKTSFETAAIEWALRDRNKYEGLLYSTIMPSTCNKIMKKSILDSLKLEYIEDKYEDLSLNPLFMLKAKTIKYINKPYYEYYLRSGSLMRSSAGYSMINIIKELNKRLDDNKDIVNVDINEFKYYTYSWRIEEYIMNQLYDLDKKEKDEYIDIIYKKLYEICNEIFEGNNYRKMLDKVKKETYDFIKERNNQFKNKKIKDFMKQNQKKDTIKKLTPQIIYYGEK